MFGTPKIPTEFIDLLVDVYATETSHSSKGILAEKALQWVRDNMKHVTVAMIHDRISMRFEKWKDELDNAKKNKDKDKDKVKPRKFDIPSRDAKTLLELWVDYINSNNSNIVALYTFESLLYSLCPEIKDWGDDPNYDLRVYNGKVWVIEELD